MCTHQQQEHHFVLGAMKIHQDDSIGQANEYWLDVDSPRQGGIQGIHGQDTSG